MPRSVPAKATGRARTGLVTNLIIGVCTLVFALTLLGCPRGSASWGEVFRQGALGLVRCPETYRRLGALGLSWVWLDDEWWRVGTTAAVHGSLLHLVLNMWSLRSLGRVCEGVLGGWWMAGAFATGALVGSLACLAWAEAPMVVGASGGVLGIASGLLLERVGGAKDLRRALAEVSPLGLTVSIAALLVFGAVVPVVSQAGHIGGLLGGAGFAWVWRQHGWMRSAVAAVLLGGLAGLLQIARAPTGRPNYPVFLARAYVERGEYPAAVEQLEGAWVQREGTPELANELSYTLALAGVQLARADSLVDFALRSDPGNWSYLDTKGWVACRRGDAEDGVAWLERARAAGPEAAVDPELLAHLRDCRSAGVQDE